MDGKEKILKNDKSTAYPAAESHTLFAAYELRTLKLFFMALIILTAVCSFNARADIIYSSLSDRASMEDKADLLSADEIDELLDQAGLLASEYSMDIRLVTTDDAQGKSTMRYSDDYFESLTNTYEGACCCIDMDNREIYLTTEGTMIWYMNDSRVDKLLDNAYNYVSDGDFAGTFRSMLSDLKRYLRAGVEHGTVQYDEDTGTYTYYAQPKGITAGEGIVSVIMGFISAVGVFFGVKGKYQLKFPEKDNFSFRDNVKMSLSAKEDSFVRRFVTQRRIQRNHSSGGGGSHTSTTHHTSSGHSAGGGGRKF